MSHLCFLLMALVLLASAQFSLAQEPYRPTSVWRPKGKTSWQWQLSGENYTGIIKQRPTMLDVDIDNVQNLYKQITKLGMKRTDFKIICYFSMGTFETFRQADDKARGIDWPALQKQYPTAFIGAAAPPWGNEIWLNIADPKAYQPLLDVMKIRTKAAYDKGCDGVEYDNIGVYQEYPKKVTVQDQLRFNGALLDYAHSLNLSVGLKNLAELIPMTFADGRQVGAAYDWFLSEECFTWGSCNDFNVLPKDRVVFGVEYCDEVKVFGGGGKNMRPECFCPVAIANPRFSWLYKAVDLTAPGFSCDSFCATPNKCTAPAKNNTRLCGVSKPTSLCPKYAIKSYM